MNDEDSTWNWHDQRGVTWAAGLAAVALIVLLVWAVLRVSNGSPLLPGSGPSAPSQSTLEKAPSSRATSATTSYSRPSVQTTELNPAPTPEPSPAESLPEDPATTSTSTTIYNPYATTTTQNGGAV